MINPRFSKPVTGLSTVATPIGFDYSLYTPGGSIRDYLDSHGNPFANPFRYLGMAAGAAGGYLGPARALTRDSLSRFHRAKWATLPLISVPIERTILNTAGITSHLEQAGREGSLVGGAMDTAKDWLPHLGIGALGLGALGLGAYAYNQHRNRKQEEELAEKALRSQSGKDRLQIQVPGKRLSENFYRNLSRDLLFNNENLAEIYDV